MYQNVLLKIFYGLVRRATKTKSTLKNHCFTSFFVLAIVIRFTDIDKNFACVSKRA